MHLNTKWQMCRPTRTSRQRPCICQHHVKKTVSTEILLNFWFHFRKHLFYPPPSSRSTTESILILEDPSKPPRRTTTNREEFGSFWLELSRFVRFGMAGEFAVSPAKDSNEHCKQTIYHKQGLILLVHSKPSIANHRQTDAGDRGHRGRR